MLNQSATKIKIRQKCNKSTKGFNWILESKGKTIRQENFEFYLFLKKLSGGRLMKNHPFLDHCKDNNPTKNPAMTFGGLKTLGSFRAL